MLNCSCTFQFHLYNSHFVAVLLSFDTAIYLALLLLLLLLSFV